MNTIVSVAAVLVAVVMRFVATYQDESAWVAVGLIVATAVVVPLVFYPVSKTLWSAIDLAATPARTRRRRRSTGSAGHPPRALTAL